MGNQFIYRFSSQTVDGNGEMKDELGGKGTGLAEMARLSIPIPPGFTISTKACRFYLERGEMPPTLKREMKAALEWLQKEHGRTFNGKRNPLLVSVRSGAAVSMPGMMDTILNVGLNSDNLDGLAQNSGCSLTSATALVEESTGSIRFALDSYRRLLQMFGAVVLAVPKKRFDIAMEAIKKHEGVLNDSQLSESALRLLVNEYKSIILEVTGQPFPEDAYVQLTMATEAVFRSWKNERAQHYRRLVGIADESGTAVTIQAMAFGNSGLDSGTGVGFTRNPSTGEREIFGEFLQNAQGEDIVAGIRTPMPIAQLERTMPSVYSELCSITSKLETHFRDAQDFEFTVERGKLFLLQTRSAKRSALASVRIAVEMVNEGLISKHEAIQRVMTSSIAEILSPQIDFSAGVPEVIARGLAASPGAAVGRIVLTADEAVEAASREIETPLILVTQETTADDIHGMAVSVGFLTAHGGATSHAAVVARGMGKCCITGANGIVVDERHGKVKIGDHTFRTGDWITLEGSSGRVFAGKLPVRAAETRQEEFETLMQWTTDLGSTVVRANADTPEDALTSKEAGAQGIGLCRTEHMFFASERLPYVRSMILASTEAQRARALAKLLEMQQSDFEAILRKASPYPVTIRLLDPPLHEFLPGLDELKSELREARSNEDPVRVEEISAILERVESLTESNPMMGHRGCRLSITYPEILVMQVTAILQAALRITEDFFLPAPEIMLPLVACAEEVRFLRQLIDRTAGEVFEKVGRSVEYKVGTMIELPRAAVCAASFANEVSFVSFGTNDLTQMTFGFSRDDARKYLDSYLELGILSYDPFLTLDRDGVGSLIQTAIGQLRAKNPKIKIGICGEHGGDPASIEFLIASGVDYISCSPARIPYARLAAAQTDLKLAAETEKFGEIGSAA